jgi:hypothetical protein
MQAMDELSQRRRPWAERKRKDPYGGYYRNNSKQPEDIIFEGRRTIDEDIWEQLYVV